MTTPTSRHAVNWPHLTLLLTLTAGLAVAQTARWSLPTVAAGATVFILAWLGLAEWRWPHRPDWVSDAAERRREWLYLGVAALASAASRALMNLLAAAAALVWQPSTAMAELPVVAAVVLALVLGELGAYAMHRWQHAGGWLWRVHALHHAPRRVNLLNNATAHPLNVLMVEVSRHLPLLLLGFTPEVIVCAGVFIQAQSFATHANLPGTLGWLNRFIGTAELHRRHHGVEPDEALNFGTVLPLWDQVFGTYRGLGSAEPRNVGLSEPQRYPAARRVGAWLLHPFCREAPTQRQTRGAAG